MDGPLRVAQTLLQIVKGISSARIFQGAHVLKMTGICKAYRSDVLEIFALRDFSVHVREGEFVAVTGPSGCGKTTFLTIAGMLESFNNGEYELDGVSVYRMSDQERSRLRNEKIGFIFQSFNLLADMTVRDNVEMPLRYRRLSVSERRRRVESSLYRAGLSDRASYYPAELSGGQQQRVAISRALAGSPRVLLADEPAGNLDEVMAAEVMELLHELHRGGATIIVVTHSAEITHWAEREVRIVDGSIVRHPLLGRAVPKDHE
jgi:putative ABC transport system ATP-binding protein